VGQHFVTIVGLDPEGRVLEGLDHGPFEQNGLLLCIGVRQCALPPRDQAPMARGHGHPLTCQLSAGSHHPRAPLILERLLVLVPSVSSERDLPSST
jgi:hypothetical protein